MFRNCEDWEQRMPDLRVGWTWTLRRLPWSQTVLKWELVKWRHLTLWLWRSHQDVAWGRRGEWSQAQCDRQSFMGSEQTSGVKYWFELISMWLEPVKSGGGWGVVEVRKTWMQTLWSPKFPLSSPKQFLLFMVTIDMNQAWTFSCRPKSN